MDFTCAYQTIYPLLRAGYVIPMVTQIIPPARGAGYPAISPYRTNHLLLVAVSFSQTTAFHYLQLYKKNYL
jgi:hypothetical protein